MLHFNVSYVINVVQRVPPKMPTAVKTAAKVEQVRESNNNNNNSGGEREWQNWHKNGVRCPKGTVPIRRSTVHDVLRAKSLFDFGKKRRSSVRTLSRNSPVDAPDVVSGNGHEVRRFRVF